MAGVLGFGVEALLLLLHKKHSISTIVTEPRWETHTLLFKKELGHP